MIRKGLGKGLGQGYKNIAPLDAHVHSLSAKGISTVAKPVFGKKIIDARQLTKKEVSDEGWLRSTTALILDDGTLIYPSQDDEGNDAGALFGKTPEGKPIRLGIQEFLNAKGNLDAKSRAVWTAPCGFQGTKGELTKHQKTCQACKQALQKDEVFKIQMELESEFTKRELEVLQMLNLEYYPSQNIWAIPRGQEVFLVETQLGISRYKADKLIQKYLDTLERYPKDVVDKYLGYDEAVPYDEAFPSPTKGMRLDAKQNMQVGATMLQQLGGRRFIMMTGAKDFVYDDKKKTLIFKIGRNPKGVNYVKITLNPMDTYDVEFTNIRAGKIKVKSKVEGIYNDQLEEVFRNHTGMATRLFAKKKKGKKKLTQDDWDYVYEREAVEREMGLRGTEPQRPEY